MPETHIDTDDLDLCRRFRVILGGSDAELNPVKGAALHTEWPPTDFEVEARTHAGSGRPWSRLGARLWMLLRALAGRQVFGTRIRTPLIDPKRCLASLVLRSDFRKCDGVQRLVLGAPAEKIPGLLSFLGAEDRQRVLLYGVHRPPSAMMTGVVFSLKEDSHLHSIHGSDGGYALAAVQLKEQRKMAASGLRRARRPRRGCSCKPLGSRTGSMKP